MTERALGVCSVLSLVRSVMGGAWGRLAAAGARRGGKPRRRQIDLAIAATARVEGVPLLTENLGDFRLIADLVDVRHPADA